MKSTYETMLNCESRHVVSCKSNSVLFSKFSSKSHASSVLHVRISMFQFCAYH